MRLLTLVFAASLAYEPAQSHGQFRSSRTSTGASALYDLVTGGITFLDFSGSEIGIRLDSFEGNLLPNATDLDGQASGRFGIVNTSGAPYLIEWGNFRGLEFTAAFAGNVVQPITLPSDLEIQVALSPSHIETIAFYSAIPEPSGLLLALTAAAFFTATRRR